MADTKSNDVTKEVNKPKEAKRVEVVAAVSRFVERNESQLKTEFYSLMLSILVYFIYRKDKKGIPTEKGR